MHIDISTYIYIYVQSTYLDRENQTICVYVYICTYIYVNVSPSGLKLGELVSI